MRRPSTASTLAAVVLLGGPLIALWVVAVRPKTAPPRLDGESAAVAYLLSKQDAAGAWHSSILRGRPDVTESPALTALVLAAIPPDLVADRAPIERGLRYLLANMDAEGCVGAAQQPWDLPNYATALTVIALQAWRPPEHEVHVKRAVDYLLKAQLDEGEGWAEVDPQYGGWDFGKPQPRIWNRLDISVTSYVLEALDAAGVPRGHDGFRKARVYLRACQNPDGGFNFSPHVSKAATNDEPNRSYGSVTADGLRSLRIVGADETAARQWLDRRRTVEKNPGFPTPAHSDFDRAIFYYYLRSLSVAAPAPDIAAKLRALQRPDGSWESRYGAMKERDPVIATALALWAMR